MFPTALYTKAEHESWGRLCHDAEAELTARIAKYKIPTVKYCPVDDAVLIFRLPPLEMKTSSGIVVPDFAMDRDEQGVVSANRHHMNVGVILRAGCSAMDWMRSHGILIGDMVKFAAYSGHEESSRWFMPDSQQLTQDLKDVMQIKESEILGSFDLYERLQGNKPRMKMVYAVDDKGNGLHIIKPRS